MSLSFLIRDKCAPRPLPPARAGLPLPHRRGGGWRPRSSLPAALKLRGSRRAAERASSLRLTSLPRPAASPRALPRRRGHRDPRTAFGPIGTPPPPARAPDPLAPAAAPVPAMVPAPTSPATAAVPVRRVLLGGPARERGTGRGRQRRRGATLERVRARRRKLRSEPRAGRRREGRGQIGGGAGSGAGGSEPGPWDAPHHGRAEGAGRGCRSPEACAGERPLPHCGGCPASSRSGRVELDPARHPTAPPPPPGYAGHQGALAG